MRLLRLRTNSLLRVAESKDFFLKTCLFTLPPLARDYKSSSFGDMEVHSYTNSHTNKMSVPSIVSLNSKSLQSRNISFANWLKKENSTYIAAQATKYARAKQNSPWMPSKLNFQLYNKEISQDEFNRRYESFVRKEMWSSLPTLAGKELGCWCLDPESEESQCHGKILQRLYREQSQQ